MVAPITLNMNLDELREIRDAILEHPDMETFARNVGFVISYLISEQEKRIKLNAAIDKLTDQLTARDKETAQQAFILQAMKERSERNGKLLVTTAASVLSMLLLEILRLALK